MMFKKILIANRGEVAIRIARACSELGITSVAIYPEDDAASLHVRRCDSAAQLPGRGAAAYLDIPAVIAAALQAGCDAIHPGYGFLSENAGFARQCAAAGLTFIGPSPETLDLFGDKGAARQLAIATGVPVARGTEGATTLAEAAQFLAALPPGTGAMVKAVSGGGGRGMRIVEDAANLAEAFERAGSEARASFGADALYLEELIRPARHVEVQILGDRDGTIIHLFERECSLQRRHQKIVEIAPAPDLDPALREAIVAAAVALARAAGTTTLCTFEFLVQPGSDRFVFMEANPRLQVEHTVTEEVMGVDLVQTQIRLAAGMTLAELGMDQASVGRPRGMAVELRINMEQIGADGSAVPTGGTLHGFDPPTGAGIRVETFGYPGYRTSTNFDSLLAKVIAFVPSGRLGDALQRAYRALCEFRIDGVETNIGFLQNLVTRPEVTAGSFDTGFVEAHAAELAIRQPHVLFHAPAGEAMSAHAAAAVSGPDGTIAVLSPMSGRVVSIDVAEGDAVAAGAALAVVEAMKMEHVILAEEPGIVRLNVVSSGDQVEIGAALLFLEPRAVEHGDAVQATTEDPTRIRPDLAKLIARKQGLLDSHRPDAVKRRRKTGQRTARENLEDLCDPGSFIEYGGLTVAAQRRRRDINELIAISPADGLVAGLGAVNGALFPEETARCLAMSYDYTVFAGTQGFMGHKKMDRMLELAAEWKLPVFLFPEGGGGRPGESDHNGIAGLDLQTFQYLARLSGLVPIVSIVSGRCFAGNAALVGCSDVIIATENTNLGMGGPAMIEGGGLGVFKPEEVGPVSVQIPNGVIDVLVRDEAEGVAVAKKYIGYFQGPTSDWTCADPERLRGVIPENRLRAYEIRTVIELLADTDSVLELRPNHGIGMVTAFIRIEGRPLGLIANNPKHLGGAIDAEGAEKAARFIDLCESYGLPILSLSDTPGFMVGPEAEKTGLVRRVARMFLAGANITVPLLTVVLRKGYGLGAQAMAGGSYRAPVFTISWPTGEFGGMGFEGAVRLGYRAELAAIEDPKEQQALYEKLVAELYERGSAINAASFLELDDVIDPADTRLWIVQALRSVAKSAKVAGKRRPYVPAR
jgi:acetyl/propionyl-CoA carboxylase alpha subunit/acetyl-CoA carboxylase carboxyltransferase component